MTLLDELIEGASGDTPVTTLLRKVKVVASRAEVPALDEWVEHELGGYPESFEVPEYRGPFSVEVLGTLGGPFGSGMRNAPVPSIGFPAEYRDGPLFNILFTQPIAEIEELSAGVNHLQAPWPANAIALTNSLIMQGEVNLYEGLGLQQAWRVITRAPLISIVGPPSRPAIGSRSRRSRTRAHKGSDIPGYGSVAERGPNVPPNPRRVTVQAVRDGPPSTSCWRRHAP